MTQIRDRGRIATAALLLFLTAGANSQACAPSPGTYCPSPTGDSADCPPGHYCTGSAENDHTPCPLGTFVGFAGATNIDDCQPCDSNMVALSVGQSACQLCASGLVYSASTANTCDACPAGTRSVSGDAACTPCAAGTASTSGSGSCAQCRPGSYSASGFSSGCTACPAGTFTYIIMQASSSSGAPLYTPVWGATSSLQCVEVPSATPQTPLVCLPGTRMQGAGCTPCPLGYFCPLISVSDHDVGAIQACPFGSMSPSVGAVAATDCTVPSSLVPFDFAQCDIAPGGAPSALEGLSIRAMTASSDAKTIFFATATAVYRMYLQTNTLELLAGVEGASGAAVSSAVGVDARFTDITAIGVDLDRPDATVIVVGDGAAVRAIDVYSRKVTRLGAVGDVTVAGGIALRRDNVRGARWAYVSDAAKHRIEAFNLETMQRVHVAGDIVVGGSAGSTDGYYTGARFNAPMGIAFIERSMDAGRVLLIADSGNGAIRALDTTTRVVTTWFAPLDTGINRELKTPAGLAVSTQGGTTMVYVADSGKRQISVIQQPFAAVKVLTPVRVTAGHYTAVVPYGSMVSSSATVVGYSQLLALDAAQMSALVQDMLANSEDGGGSVATCHLPCQTAGCGPLSSAELCGNSFLDAGEQCDAPVAGSGCYVGNCTLQSGFACPLVSVASTTPPATCLDPCPSHVYAPTGVAYCETDCAGLTPRSGYTIDAQCVETDIDECATNADTCDASAGMCINTPGSYRCQCFSGYFGDGVTCVSSAYAVYTLVDIPSLPASALSAPDSVTAGVMHGMEAAYAASLSSAIPSNLIVASSFTSLMTVGQLAALYTSYSVDPARPSAARIELVSLFETSEMASAVAGGISPAQLSAALSMALFGVPTGATVFQRPMVRLHRASGDSGSTAFVDGWGMNVTGVTYNRTCRVETVAEGFTVQPEGGCWQVEVVYMGGKAMPSSNENSAPQQQSKNVLYLPRIDRNADTLEALVPAQTLTMSSGAYFPCDVASVSASGQGLAPQATACCMRSVQAAYRTHTGFGDFLQSADYANGVPAESCVGPINDTYPQSDVVFTLPDSPNHDATNDLVVGKLDGMPHSEVRLLETIDYTTRTFRVLLVLEEGDLRKHASMVDGTTGLSYEMTFFVGMANFKGSGGSVLNTKHAQQFVTVTKSNSLTVSTFGSTKDPLVKSVDMQLVRVKVTDFFNPVAYMWYLKPVFTFPSNFRTPVGAASIVPLNSVRVIKIGAGYATPADSASWLQACASTNGQYIYADPALLTLVDHAQSQTCVQTDLAMCYPPSAATSVVTFGLPLPVDFITPADLAAPLASQSRIEAQFVVQAYDTTAKSNVLTTVSMSVDITPLGFTAECETASASQNLADVVSGNIYVGTAVSDYEWNSLMQKKENMDVPGSTPSNSLEFATTSVQGAVMTFAALGNAAYFEDPRYQGQSAHMHDIFTVHFLEPLSGRAGDPTPNYDAAKALFLAGGAFVTKSDAATHAMWLEPTAALLAICPLRPTIGKLACLTRIDSTYKDSHLSRPDNTVVELRMNDATSIAELQGLMANLLLQGGSNDFTNNLGSGFYAELSSKLALNNRYRKAYVVNPVINWRLDAIGPHGGSTAYTVSSKIIGIGMITLQSAGGQQLARRLLSIGLDDSAMPSVALRGVWDDGSDEDPYMAEDPTDDEPKATSAGSKSRRLLQTSEGTLAPSLLQASNSLVVNLNIPDKTAVTQLCPVIGATDETCRGLQYTNQVTGDRADQLCAAEAQGTLGTILESGMRSALMRDSNFDSNVSQVLLMHYSIQGCNSAQEGAPRRALKQTGRLVIVLTDLLLSVDTGVSVVVNERTKQYINFFVNSTTMSQLLGGSAVLTSLSLSAPDLAQIAAANNGSVPGSTYKYNMTIVYDGVNIKNNTLFLNNKNLTDYLNGIAPNSNGAISNDYFILDALKPPSTDKKSSGSRNTAAFVALLINSLVLAAVGSIALG